MRKITIMLSMVLIASFVWAQNYSQQDLDKMRWEKEQKMILDQRNQSVNDVSPFTSPSPATTQKAQWDILYSFTLNSAAQQAIAFDGTHFYTSKWNAAGNFGKYNAAGQLVSEFTIAGVGGLRDLTYDGEFFYAGASTTTLYKLDLVNQTLVGTVTAAGTGNIRHCSFDPTADNGNGGFWIGDWTNLRLISRTGAVLTPVSTPLVSVYGSAFDDVTAGGPYLWFFTQEGTVGNQVNIKQFRISDLSFTGVVKVANDIPNYVEGIAGGLFSYKDLTAGKFVILGNIQQDPNLVFGYELATLANPTAPAAPTAVTVTPAAAGALSATIAWTNPAVSVNGAALTELTAVKVYRGETLVHTLNSPAIGAAASYVDNAVPASGNYTYTVKGENTAGIGLGANASAFIGVDFPGAPTNVVLAAQGNNGLITWEAPTVGLNGGFFEPTGLTYKVTRYPGAVVVADALAALTYTDNTVPGIGNYYYAVQAINATGPGGIGNSNVTLLGAEGILFYEPFTGVAVGALPAGWVVEGLGLTSWNVQNSVFAGGTAPELRLNWSPSFNGLSRVVTPEFSVADYEALRLKFRHMLNNYTSDEGETIGVYSSFDGGTTWNEEWSVAIGTAAIPAEMKELFIDVPPGKANMKLSWLFSGNSFNINYYYVDNVIVEPVLENDLKAVSLTGNTTPTAGVATNYNFTIQNAGTTTQTTYEVKFYKQGGELIQTLPGVEVAFGETETFQFTWTPDAAFSGPTFLYAVVELTGDELPGNNQTPNLNVDVQPSGVVTVTVGNINVLPDFRIPFDFYWKNSLAQTIYYPEELNNLAGAITGINLYNNFATDLQDKPVKIWLGTTDLESLVDGWADPSEFVLVYDGEVDFPIGANTIYIPFDEPFIYLGGNLVLYTNRVMDAAYFSSSDKFYVTTTADLPNRTRHVQSDSETFNPETPPTPVATQLKNAHPDITFFFNVDGLGSLEGLVTDGTDPIEGVEIRVVGTSIKTFTNADGEYAFPYLVAGEIAISAKKHGFYDVVIEEILIEGDEVTVQDIEMEAIPTVAVSGIVTGSDAPAVGLEGATVTLEGYADYSVLTNADGEFEITGVYIDNTYDITISYAGFTTYTAEVEVEDEDLDLGTIILDEIAFPASGVVAAEEGDDVKVTWFAPGNNPVTTFRYDSGVQDGQLGFGSGTQNAVMGSAHRRNAEVHEISWYCTAEGGPHNLVNIFVLALNASGMPTSTVLYSAIGVANTDLQWNNHILPAPVTAPNGFMLAMSYSTGFLGLATDMPNAEYPFMPNTHFYAVDYTAGSFSTVESAGFQKNFFLRAVGIDFGPAAKSFDPAMARAGVIGEMPHFVASETPVVVKDPVFAFGNRTSKALVGYNVYRLLQGQEGDEALWVSLATNQTDTFKVDTQWESLAPAIYKYAVKAVYTNNVLAVPAFSNAIPKSMVAPVTITITTNGGDAPTGAAVVLTNQDGDPNHVYTATTPANGIVNFPEVWKGTYNLTVTKTGFQAFSQQDIVVADAMNIPVQLIEIIVTPYNLEAEYALGGNVLFSWNNAGAEPFFEGFEGAFPPAGWAKLNPDNGTGWAQITAGTTPIPGWQGGTADPAPDGGTKMAYATWDTGGPTANNQWLVSPAIVTAAGFQLKLHLRYWPDTYTDNVEIRISTTSQTDPAAFTILVASLNFSTGSPTDWQLLSYNLSDFVTPGSTIYVGIREYVADNYNDGAVIFVDNFFVGPAGKAAEFFPTEIQEKGFTNYKVFKNGSQVGTTTNVNYTFADMTNGSYTFGVQAVYTSGSSEIVTMDFDLAIPTYNVVFTVKNTANEVIDDAVITLNGQANAVGNYTFSGLVDGEYEFEVTHEDYLTLEGTVVVTTDHVNQTVSLSGLGILETVSNSFSVYPVPARNLVNIKATENIQAIRVTDLTGRIVYTVEGVNADNHQFDVSAMNEGIYFIQLLTSKGYATRKFQVVK